MSTVSCKGCKKEGNSAGMILKYNGDEKYYNCNDCYHASTKVGRGSYVADIDGGLGLGYQVGFGGLGLGHQVGFGGLGQIPPGLALQIAMGDAKFKGCYEDHLGNRVCEVKKKKKSKKGSK